MHPRARFYEGDIRDGAVLVQSPEDVIELLSGFDGRPRAALRESSLLFEPDQEAEADDPADIAGLLGSAPVAVDELIRQSGQSASAVQLALLELELSGQLARHAGGKVSLVTG